MRITFIVPPSLDGELPAEQTAGCMRFVYPMPNRNEPTVAAVPEKEQEVFVSERKNDLFTSEWTAVFLCETSSADIKSVP
jgi:hypothetical protein